jgi:hypothetical protein
MKARLKKWFVGLMATVLVIFTALLFADNSANPVGRAIISMAWGLIILWVFVGGFLMYRFRNRVRRYVLELPGSWKMKFILFATLLACLEEMVTVLMTNLAPAFGVEMGRAYITASANFFDVILFHSVIVFVPLFFATASLLKRYQFSPFAVFIFFGIVGTVAESLFSGDFSHIVTFYQWVFVYGLMVYLPAYSIPHDRGALPPRWWHYVLAVPYIFFRALPVIIIIAIIIVGVLGHPNVHFPPIQG